MRPRAIEREVEPQLKALPYSTATVKQDVSDQLAWYLLEHRDEFRGRGRGARVPAPVPAPRDRRAPVRHRRRDERRSRRRIRATATWTWATAWASPAWSSSTTASCAAGTGPAACRWTRSGTSTGGSTKREPVQGRQLRLSVDLDVQEAGQEALAGGTGRGAFAVMDVKTRRGARPRLRAVLRPEHLLQGHQGAGLRPPPGRGQRRAAHQPRDPGRLSHRLHLQAGHRHGGARERADHARTPRSTTRARTPSATPTFENAGKVAHGALALRQALTVSSDVFFYQLGDQLNSNGDGLGAPALGAPPRDRPQHGHRPPRASCPGCCPRRSGATTSSRPATPSGPGPRATT